jgi:hypothetical protein
VALGLVGQVKIIPQWLLAAYSSSQHNNSFQLLNLVGAFLIMGSAAAYAIFNFIRSPSVESAAVYQEQNQNHDKECPCRFVDEELANVDGNCREEERPLLIVASSFQETTIPDFR